MNIEKLTKAKELISKVFEAFEQEFKEAGIAVSLLDAKYSSVDAKLKINIVDLDSTGSAVDVAAQIFKENYARYGLNSSDLGAELIVEGNKVKLCGLDTSKPKRPIIVKSVMNGKIYAMDVTAFKAHIKYYQGGN